MQCKWTFLPIIVGLSFVSAHAQEVRKTATLSSVPESKSLVQTKAVSKTQSLEQLESIENATNAVIGEPLETISTVKTLEKAEPIEKTSTTVKATSLETATKTKTLEKTESIEKAPSRVVITPPVVTLDKSLMVNQKNVQNYALSGSCDSSAHLVDVTIPGAKQVSKATASRELSKSSFEVSATKEESTSVKETTTEKAVLSLKCSDSRWAGSVDLSAIADGEKAVAVRIAQKDATLAVEGVYSTVIPKDATPPTLQITDNGAGVDKTYNRAELSSIKIGGRTTGVEAGAEVSLVVVAQKEKLARKVAVQADGAWILDERTAISLADTVTEPVTLTVNVSDLAGNPAVEVKQIVPVDSIAPNAPAVTIVADINNDGYLGSEELLNVEGTVDVLVSLTDTGAVPGDILVIAGMKLEISKEDLLKEQISVPVKLVEEGTLLTVEAHIVDAAGNVGESGKDSATVDTTAPAAPSVLIANDTNDDGFINLVELDNNPDIATLLVSLKDTGALPGDTLFIAGLKVKITKENYLQEQVNIEVKMPEEGQEIVAEAYIIDAAGNKSLNSMDTAVVDTTSPSIPTVESQITNSLTPVILGTSGTGIALAEGERMAMQLADATYEIVPDSTGAWKLSLDTDKPIQGVSSLAVNQTYSVDVIVIDAAGNQAADITNNELIIDGSPPELTAFSAGPATDTTPELFGVTDQPDGSSVRVLTTTGGMVCSAAAHSSEWQCLPDTPFTEATHELNAETTDAAGNVTVVPFSVIVDLDSDDDGIPDVVEGSSDLDGDSIPDALDPDSDNDGIPDNVEDTNTPALSGMDSDGDNIDDAIDVDSTGGQDINMDGIDDALAPNDTDKDGIPDFRDEDSDGDSIPDAVEAGGGANIDSDADGIPDVIDLDSDNDGIPDEVEANSMGGKLDSDEDSIPDHLDLDSDNDGLPDLHEAWYKPEEVAAMDTDGDYRIDANMGTNGLADSVETDADSGRTDYNADSEADSPMDTDNDGVADYVDIDSDGDSLTDLFETAGTDNDGNGRIDQFSDYDNDGLADALIEFPAPHLNADGDAAPNHLDLDSDNDGVPDFNERNLDSDGDTVANYQDLDSDNDGLTDNYEAGGFDSDGNGVVDSFVDADNDGYDDALAVLPLGLGDFDGDLVIDMFDLDSDNDGLSDHLEAVDHQGDIDGNGVIDDFADLNLDGLDDAIAMVFAAPNDTDADTAPDHLDLDSDNDLVSDAVEAGMVDENGDGVIDVLADSDADGIPDSVDFDMVGGSDSDNDGIEDSADADFSSEPDTDGDGIIDSRDADRDGDGFINDDGFNSQPNAQLPDANNNGIADVHEPTIVAATGTTAPISSSPGIVVTGVSGGCSLVAGNKASIDPLLPLLSILAMITMLIRRRKSAAAKFAVILPAIYLSGCASFNNGPDAGEFNGTDKDFHQRIYAGAGLGLSRLDPDTSRANADVNQRVDPAADLLLGYDISQRISAEVKASELGDAGLTDDTDIQYRTVSASMLVYGLNRKARREKRRGWGAFGRVGGGRMFNKANGPTPSYRDNDNHFLLGAGVEYGFRNGLALRAEGTHYDTDAQAANLGVVYRFGKQKSVARPIAIAPAAAPVPVLTAVSVAPREQVLASVNFATNSSTLTHQGILTLNEVTQTMRKDPKLQILIHANTDSVGDLEFNQRLSERRAASVMQYLTQSGLSADRMQHEAVGETMPVSDNASAEGRLSNRRVDITSQ